MTTLPGIPEGRVLKARFTIYNPTREGSMANREQLKVLRQGVRAWNEWRVRNNPLIDLSGANLSGIDLSSRDVFTHLEMHLGNLSESDFSRANLGGASLVNAELMDCNFQGASLSGCEMSGATWIYCGACFCTTWISPKHHSSEQISLIRLWTERASEAWTLA